MLPPDYFALPEQSIRGPVPDVLTLNLSPGRDEPNGAASGLAVASAPPRARLVRRAEETIYVRKADRIAVRHRHGQVVAVVEIVSPGNKASKNELRTFVEKTANLIMQGIHLLVIDLFPPSKRDPQGIHKAIWDELVEEDFELPADERLTLAAYDAGPPPVAYVEPIAVGAGTAGHADFPEAGFLRAGAARGDLSDNLGRLLSRADEEAAGGKRRLKRTLNAPPAGPRSGRSGGDIRGSCTEDRSRTRASRSGPNPVGFERRARASRWLFPRTHLVPTGP